MKTYYERRYFTLDDIKNDLGILPTYKGPLTMKAANEKVKDFIDACLQKCECSSPALTFSSEADEMFQSYLWPKYYNAYVCFTDDETIADDESEKVFADFIGVIIAWLASSDEKYSLLINNLEANKTKLLGAIKSSTISRYNDTPQNQGEFDDDEHNTNVTKNESETDGTTLLARLNEIEDNLKMLYDRWSNEFRDFIFWSVK